MERRRLAAAAAGITVLTALVLVVAMPGQATDYTFGTPDLIIGGGADLGNKDAADGSYAQLIEEDTDLDDNQTIADEIVTRGSTGGALSDASSSNDAYRTLTEADANPTDYTQTLVPTSDSSVGFDVVYPADGVHYTKVDEGASHDSATTYVRAATNLDKDIFGLEDMTTPSGTPDLDVAVYVICQDAGTGTAYFDAGLRISSTHYVGVNDQAAPNTWASYTYSWELNPATSSEWTYTAINAVELFIEVYDAAPDVDVTSAYIVVNVDYSPNYQLSVTHEFEGVSEPTSGYELTTEAKVSNGESFYCQVWDFTGSSWTTRITVDSLTDEWNYYALASSEYSADLDQVKLRWIGATETGDSTQSTLSIDMCTLRLKNITYDLEVEMTASSLPATSLQLVVKGYTSPGEVFRCSLWNYSSSAYDEDKILVTDTSNTQYTYSVLEEHHISVGYLCKVRFTDTTLAETTLDTLFLDFICLRTENTEPTITGYSHLPDDVNVGETLYFWCVYTDADDDAPSYVRVVIDSVNYALAKNTTDDVYTDGCNYHLEKSDLARGSYTYHYAVSDGVNPEVTTSPSGEFLVNGEPYMTQTGHSPPTGNNGDTFSFWALYWDDDNDAPVVLQVNIGGTDYDLVKNGTDDVYTDSCAYHYDKAMPGGTSDYYFHCTDWLSDVTQTSTAQVDVNNKPTLGSYDRVPADPVYPTTQLTFTVVYTDLDGELPAAIKWREGGGAIQNVTMTAAVPEDLDVTDGKAYTVSLYLSHGDHNYDFYASDGTGTVSGGSGSVTIGNRAPTITTTPDDDTEWRNTAWELDLAAEDLDNDAVAWELSTNATGMTIDGDTGLLEWTTPDNPSWYTITVWANDSYSGSDSHELELYIENRLPVISSSGNTTQALGTFLSYCIVASDADLDTLTYELSTDCAQLSIENNWVNGTVSVEGDYSVTVWVNDTYGGDMEAWALSVDNEAPYFTSTPIYSAANGSYYEYDANASDPNPGSTITYSLETNCTDLVVDAETGVVNGTLTLVGSYFVNVTASDGTLATSQNYTLTVTNTLPVFTTSPGLEGVLGVPYYFDADATDANGDVLEFDVYEGPVWLFVDAATGEVEGTPTTTGAFAVKIRAFDGYGYSWLNWTLTVPAEEEPPVEDPVVEEDGGSGIFGIALSMMIVCMMLAVAAAMFDRKRKKAQ